jgi:hypothetical protein
MPQTRTTCPRCRQPVMADLEQLFDVTHDPEAKQRLLSGAVNTVNCPNCGYQGGLATPIVYHDNEKELLLTYFPPELAMAVNDQERLIGPYITQITNRLPPEKRKAYLLRPTSMFTFQSLVEKILAADGITKEMLQAQQARLQLLQRLASSGSEERATLAGENQELMDEAFFSLVSQLVEVSLAQGDEQSARQLAALQQELLSMSPIGREMKAQAEDAQAAIQSLQEAAKDGLTREKLLDLIIAAESETRLTTLVSAARTGIDYEFYQILTNRIESASADQKQKLTDLREKLLQLTREIDEAMQAKLKEARNKLEELIGAPDIEKATREFLPEINDFFVEALKEELQIARQKGYLDRVDKMQKIVGVLQAASAPPPEVQLIEKLLSVPDDEGVRQILQQNEAKITPEFLQLLNSVAEQSQTENQNPEISQRLRQVYRLAMRFVMQKNLTR